MDSFFSLLTFLLNDTTIFVLLELFILIVFILSITKGRKNFHDVYMKKLRTGDLVLAYSIISAALIQALSSVSLFAEFKLGIIIANLVASFYLCFFSTWFQHLIGQLSLRVIRKTQTK